MYWGEGLLIPGGACRRALPDAWPGTRNRTGVHRPGRLWIRIGTGSGATGSDRVGENGVRDAERPPGPTGRPARVGGGKKRTHREPLRRMRRRRCGTSGKFGKRSARARNGSNAGPARPAWWKARAEARHTGPASGGRNRRKGAFRKWLARNEGEGAGKGRTPPGPFSIVPYEFSSDPLRPEYAEAVPCGDGRTR